MTKNLLVAFVVSAVLGFAFERSTVVSSAEAATISNASSLIADCTLGAGKYVATLNATDAGSSNTYCFPTANQTAKLVCAIPACYRTGSATALNANCATDDVLIIPPLGVNVGVLPTTSLNQNPSVEMANDTCLVVRAFDGGDPNCRVQQQKFNPGGK